MVQLELKNRSVRVGDQRMTYLETLRELYMRTRPRPRLPRLGSPLKAAPAQAEGSAVVRPTVTIGQKVQGLARAAGFETAYGVGFGRGAETGGGAALLAGTAGAPKLP